ncbi:heavy-metal-associated domain-containing protein [Roseibium aggregatum]|uniref:heavy-metal-associated domain-containing protein n=1 Tax=Roseibium aggregatum TaxID=187304 RepID=UPI001A8EE82B|nr:cation transporter [Roseibium aggregatum]MBN8182017.1 cation transporter [Roseibium aggregatum]
MKIQTPVLALISLLVAAPAFAAEQTVTFSVPGMHCPSCPFIVESAMGSVEGVTQVTADSDALTAEVVFDDAVASAEDIARASAAAGYKADLVTPSSGS